MSPTMETSIANSRVCGRHTGWPRQAGIEGEFLDRRSAGAHQQAIADLLMAAEHVPQLCRDRHGDVEVMGRQQLGRPGLEPVLRLVLMTFRAAAIVAAVVGWDLGAARGAAPKQSAEQCGVAGQDVRQGTPVRRKHRRAMGIQVGRTEQADDVCDFDHDAVGASKIGHDVVEEASEGGSGRRGTGAYRSPS